MEPSPHLVLLTTKKINDYLRGQNQTESHISEAYVFQALRDHISTSMEVGLILSDNEISDRVATIAIRRIRANIVTAQRFKEEWQSLMVRPYSEDSTNFQSVEASQIPSRGQVALRQQRYDGELPSRHIHISD